VNAAADLIRTIRMKHWDWSAKGVVKCLGAQNESGKVNRNIPNGQSWQDMSWTLAKLIQVASISVQLRQSMEPP
jgi:hypothetical protein